MDASLDTLLAQRAWVRALAVALVGRADADDLEQEAWLAALERPPGDEAPRAWLATVLRRTASRMRRTLSRRAARERVAARPEATGAAADLVALAETHERVVRAVLALPEPYRSTILLRFFEGLSPPEIARRTGAPVDTVKARLRRGLARLRTELPEDRAWSVALLALAMTRRPPSLPVALGALGMSLKTKILVAALAILLCGSLIAGRALDRAGVPGRAQPPREAASSAATPPAVPAEAPAPGAPPLPAPPEAREFVVKGSVRGTLGPVYPDPRMMRPLEPFVIGVVDGERTLWPTLESGGSARGTYRARFPFLAPEAPCEVELGVLAFGFVRQSRKLVVEPGGAYEADFVLERGETVGGTVADPEGRPVPHLEILAVPSATPPWGLVTAYLLDTRRRLLADEHFARGAVDASGRFEISGLLPGRYALLADSADWILAHDALEAPKGDVRVVAIPAHAITGTIRDARTGARVATASFEVTVRTPGGQGSVKTGGARNGALRVVWKPQAGEIGEGFEAALRVEADGYHAAERVLSFPRGTRRVSGDILLDPVDAEELAVARIEVTDTRGRLVDEELACVLHGIDDPERHPTTLEFLRVGAGAFELRAPPGRWSVLIAPRHGMGEPLRWSGVVDLGRDEAVRCALPAFGVVRLRHAAAGSWIAEAETPDGNRSYHWQVEAAEIRLAAAPGEWKVGRDGQESRTIVVQDGAESIVDLD